MQQPIEKTLSPDALFDKKIKIKEGADKLCEMLSNSNQILIGSKSYQSQVGYSDLIGKNCLLARPIVQFFIQNYEVNTSNNYGLTLLHNLIWFKRFDLAELIIKFSFFNKINFKFCIPAASNIMYSSALDLAICMWAEKKTDLNFISLLLEYGAVPPVPCNKFLNMEFYTFFFPIIASNIADSPSRDDLSALLCLLARYGFSLTAFQENLLDRQFQPDTYREFISIFKISLESQTLALEEFMKVTKTLFANNKEGKKLRVKMDEKRIDKGESTLQLPDNCCIV
jgi:hypothetical protein